MKLMKVPCKVEYDKVLLLDHGKVVAYDHPRTLLANGNEYYSSMLAEAGLLEHAKVVLEVN